MKIYEMPAGRYYMVAAFMTNLRTCMYCNQTSLYFNCRPPTLEAYLALVDDDTDSDDDDEVVEN